MTLTMPPKEVDAVNALKTELQKNIDTLLKIGNENSSYKEYFGKISSALKKLGKLEINVATLHVTKIGKLMTKYERDLPEELSDVAKRNNVKWKELLTAYREEFKKKKFIKLNEVKEEPLSQNSYNDLLASQEEPCNENESDCVQDENDEANNDMNDSYDMLLASQGFGPDNEDGSVFLTSTPMEQDLQPTKSNNTSNSNTTNDKQVDTSSKHFLTDVRKVVGTLTTTLSSVEMECTKMKTMIEYLNNRINDYENNLSHQQQKNGIITTSQPNPIKETFQKTGRAVMPKLLKPSPCKNTNSTSTEPSGNSGVTTHTSNHRISRIITNNNNSNEPTTSRSKDKAQNKIITSSENGINYIIKISKEKAKDTSSVDSIRKNSHQKNPAQVSENRDDTENEQSDNINLENVDTEELNPCTSSSSDETLPYPLNEIKQEADDIEFYRLRTVPLLNNGNETIINNNKSPNGVSQKKKRKSLDENDEVPSKVTLNKTNNISEKISQISQSLKRRSIDENTTGHSSSLNTKNSVFSGESSNSSGESSKGSGECSRKVPNESSSSSSSSSRFDIDSDGFTIPKVVSQNDVQLSGEQVLLKGVDTMPSVISYVDLTHDERTLPSFIYPQQQQQQQHQLPDKESYDWHQKRAPTRDGIINGEEIETAFSYSHKMYLCAANYVLNTSENNGELPGKDVLAEEVISALGVERNSSIRKKVKRKVGRLITSRKYEERVRNEAQLAGLPYHVYRKMSRADRDRALFFANNSNESDGSDINNTLPGQCNI